MYCTEYKLSRVQCILHRTVISKVASLTMSKPNFLIVSPVDETSGATDLWQIVADDLGFSDVGAFGSEVSCF